MYCAHLKDFLSNGNKYICENRVVNHCVCGGLVVLGYIMCSAVGLQHGQMVWLVTRNDSAGLLIVL